MKGLSPKQRQVLDILEHAVREGQHLTVREIGDRIGVSSTCTVHQHLKALERKGYLKPTNHRHRSIELTSPPRPFVTVPFRGAVAAGNGDMLAAPAEDSMLLPTDLIGQGESEVFQVSGHSMTENAICNGDLLVVRRGEEARDGDVVVATVHGAPVVGKIARENGYVRLCPESLGAETVAHEEGTTILGRVSVVIRRL